MKISSIKKAAIFAKAAGQHSIKQLSDKQKVVFAVTAVAEATALTNLIAKRNTKAFVVYCAVAGTATAINTAMGTFQNLNDNSFNACYEGAKAMEKVKAANEEKAA